MTKEEAEKRIEKLKKTISHHRYLYHVLDRQEISDAALDSLKHELYRLEQQFPEFITFDSPTQRIGGEPLKKFKKVEHEIPMLSMEDVFSEKELQEWESYLKRLLPSVVDEAKASSPPSLLLRKSSVFEYFSEAKIDGFSVTLVYEKGILAAGATRGNGRVGEDVTSNLKTIESIPLKLEIKKVPSSLSVIAERLEEKLKGKIEIRGEVYMEKANFEKFNKELEEKGQKTFANPRNLAAGSIRQLDPKLAASRPLKFLAYDIVTDMGQKKHSEKHQILPVLGFKTDPGKVCESLSDTVDYWQNILKKRENLPFQIDGVVVSINDNSLFQKLGVVGKSPRAIRAFKFSPEQATTRVLDIKVQIGRTGALTPVAYLEPVEAGGVTITRATLHNEDEIRRLGVKIGDTVIVGRAGDVIPDIIKVLPELRTGKEQEFKMPKNCPACGTRLAKPETEVVWRCPNPKCFARQKEYFYHFVSKNAFDVVGLGPKIVEKLLDAGLISDPADIFKLEVGDIIPLESLPCKPRPFRKNGGALRGFAERSAKNLISAVQSKKKIILSRLIYALGIRNVGEETAQDLAEFFGSLEKLKRASPTELEEIVDVGPVVAKSIYQWFQQERNLELLEKLKKAGVEIIEKKKPKYQPLKGKIFVLTGSLETIARQKAKEKIRLLGGGVSESVSERTDYVVLGKEPGAKYEKAKELGVKTINEKEFLEMVK